MRFFCIVAVSILFLTSCKRQETLVFNNKDEQIIAIIPIDSFDISQLDKIVSDIADYYKKRVIIFKPINIPASYRNSFVEQYSADSILSFLSQFKNDSIVEIIGVTRHPIFTVNKDHQYFEENLLGYGDHPGNACVISDKRLIAGDTLKYDDRLKKVVIHEIGHNMGLDHCKDLNCIMSESNRDLHRLDKSNAEYCFDCRKKLDN